MKKLLIFLFLAVSYLSYSQEKAMYVNDFKNIVGDAAEEDDLLQFAVDNDFTYLILYNMYYIHNNLFDITDSIAALPLSNFIHKAKVDYGINKIGAVGVTYNSYNNIHGYNLAHINTPDERLDIYNMEFEFWSTSKTGPGGVYCNDYLTSNGFPCTKDGAFSFIINDLCKMDSLCNEYPWLNSEYYIGNPTDLQAAKLAMCSDRVLVHYYKTSDTLNYGRSIYNFKTSRIPALTDSVSSIHVMPIFNSKPNYMGPWLQIHLETQVFNTWLYGVEGYESLTDSWKDKVVVDGYTWYRYTDMSAIPLALDIENNFYYNHVENGIKLYWMDEILDVNNITLQRSHDTDHWENIYNYTINHTEIKTLQSFLDIEPIHSTVFYRLVYTDSDNSTIYSQVLEVGKTAMDSGLFLSPNPATDNVCFDNNELNIDQVKIYDASGKFEGIYNVRNNCIDISNLNNGVHIVTSGSRSEIVFIGK